MKASLSTHSSAESARALEREIVMQVRTCLLIALSLLMPVGVPAALGEKSSSQTTNQTQREQSLVGLTTLRGIAEKGDAVAQYKLGSSYLSGSGVQQDYQEAAKWFKLAAEQEDM